MRYLILVLLFAGCAGQPDESPEEELNRMVLLELKQETLDWEVIGKAAEGAIFFYDPMAWNDKGIGI